MDIDTSKGQAPSYPLSTTYYFSGKVEFDADGDGTPDVATEFFDTDGFDPEPPGAESDPLESYEVSYREGEDSGGNFTAEWDPTWGRLGRWDGGEGYASREDAYLAALPPNEVFHIGTVMKIHVIRGGEGGTGAGNQERCAFYVLLRFRASQFDPRGW